VADVVNQIESVWGTGCVPRGLNECHCLLYPQQPGFGFSGPGSLFPSPIQAPRNGEAQRRLRANGMTKDAPRYPVSPPVLQ
jgi:hypothetical protein